MTKNFIELNKRAAKKIEDSIRQLSGQEIRVKLSGMAKKEVQEISSFMEPEKQVVALFSPITGSLEGAAVIIILRETAFSIADYLQRRKAGTTRALTELDNSAIKELGNIVVCNYLAVIANEFKTEIKSRGVLLNQDLFAAISREIISMISKGREKAFVVEIVFEFESYEHRGHIMFLLDEQKMNALSG